MHAQRKALSAEYGNRPGVKDVILVVTDGKASDQELVNQVSLDLRQKGVLVSRFGKREEFFLIIAVRLARPTIESDLSNCKKTRLGGLQLRDFKATFLNSGNRNHLGTNNNQLIMEVCRNRKRHFYKLYRNHTCPSKPSLDFNC